VKVVFDASRRSNKSSINKFLAVGNTRQRLIPQILVNWRCYKFAYTADGAKMYRQINVHKEDRKFMRIKWFGEENKLCNLRMTTLAYGMSSPSYLDVKCLHKIADHIAKETPKEAERISKDFYMVDLVSGDHSITEAKRTIKLIKQAMDFGKYWIRKWTVCDTVLQGRFLKKIEKQMKQITRMSIYS
jgi:hypothetical protein